MKNEKNQNKGFLYQITVEIKKIFTSKIMLIMIALLLLFSIAVPILSKIISNKESRNYYGYDMEDLMINGQVISTDNPQYWEIMDLNEQAKNLTNNASTPADDLALTFVQTLLDSNLKCAAIITSHEGYRSSLVFKRTQQLTKKFIYENLDKPKEDLLQAIQYYTNDDLESIQKEYYSLSQIEVLEKLQNIEDKIAVIDNIIVNSDYKEYYKLEIQNQHNQHKINSNKIEALENDILENSKNEKMYNEQIEGLVKSNKAILEISIPTYEYRLEQDIIPNSSDWRDKAANDKQSAQHSLFSSKVLTQTEFESDDYLKNEHSTYQKYKKAKQKEIDIQTNKLYIAEKSLESGKPDMKYVPNGSRKQVTNFLFYSIVVAILGTIIGGGLISSEFKSGTVRLLLIRPKTRIKIILSKLFALLAICLLLYFTAALLNIITNGILFGFNDYLYPNYTLLGSKGGVGFFAEYASKFLICFVSILFACTTAYSLSMMTKNTALSVAIPFALIVGSLIYMTVTLETMQFNSNSSGIKWLVYTPIPYINLFIYYITDMWNEIKPIFGFGIPMMISISSIMVAIGSMMFKRCDITN